jgi:2-keto-4-pentenoate hydratase/2-oxohepta-3-ene-1,7-dioic acid hydratase in catechol pathway
MQWVRVDHNGQPVFGVLEGDTITLTSLSWADVLAGQTPDHTGTLPLADARLLAPIERPAKIVAIGQNYWDHCREQNKPAPEKPIIFTKFTTALNDPAGELVWSDALTQQVDFEVELAVIIGRTARRVSEADALNYVFGYTVANDVTARDLQYGDKQWVRGKSLDTFCPLGPALVTADAIPDPQALKIGSTLNGQPMQNSSTSEMVFSVAHLIAYCSQAFTLEPGDVLLTGTPDGVGVFRNPPIFMQDGDVIAVEIEGIGRFENRCRISAS